MGYPSGSFSSPHSGRLRVSFSGEYFASRAVGDTPWDHGGPQDATTPYLNLMCYLGPTTSERNVLLTEKSPYVEIVADYTGGTVLPVGMRLSSYYTGIGVKNLRVRCVLTRV